MEEPNGFRAWLRSKAKMITIYAACVSAVLGTAVAWGSLDLPRPAWHSEVQELEQLVASNTKLILGDKWVRLKATIEELTAQLRGDPANRDLIDRLVRAQQQLRETEQQLDGS